MFVILSGAKDLLFRPDLMFVILSAAKDLLFHRGATSAG
jgi:hypothetical protein